ncbi:MAG TPA: DUF3426 domain-containing protein [Stellaceae bacterium]|nr:DUF3426 domain-containing protein [Stellaceae bacterium]
MILTCPACSVRYLVDPAALGAGGRMVRCARCGHTWRQAPPADALLPADPPLRAEPPPPRETAPSVAANERIRLPALARPPRRWGRGLAWAAVLVAVIVGLGAGAIYERDRVASLVPGTAPLFALAGFPVSEGARGLVFRNVTTSRDMENGLPALVIKGEVANVSSVARTVPKLVATLRDSDEHALQRQSFTAPAERLLPGESVAFQTSIAQPAEAAAGVVVTFAGGGK